MKRFIFFLTLLLTACLTTVQAKRLTDNNTSDAMKIRVSDGTNTITYELNETSAASRYSGL